MGVSAKTVDVQMGRAVRALRESLRGVWPSWVASRRPVQVGGLAAALCAALLVTLFRLPHLRHARWHDYVTVAGQRQKMTLRDGTAFTLAPVSRLRVPFDYASGDRRVVLDGEAFFAVVHDDRHPFSVRAHNAIATDIGTRFDVRAYGSDRDVRVAVTEGKVGIEPVGAAFMLPVDRPPVVVRPGDMAVVIDTAVAITHGLDVTTMTAWTDGDLRFRDTPLPEVAATLGRWFDLEIDARDPALANRLITMSVGTTPIDEVLSGVAGAAHARVERRGRRVTFTTNPRDE